MPRDLDFTPPVDPVLTLPVTHVPRPHMTSALLERLQGSPILLLRAPAGYGKTTLLIELQQHIPSRALYLSLDTPSIDAATILGWLISHYRQTYPEAAERAEQEYTATRRFDQAYRVLLQTLAANHDTCLLILDDYPVKRVGGIENVEYMVNHHPPDWRIIISSRGKPDLPWARWSAGGQVTELTDREIAFSGEETARLVSDVLGYDLMPEDRALLEADYQGWPLGLKLMAHALRDFSAEEFSQTLRVLHRERGLVIDLNDYFDYDVYQSLEPNEAEQTFLLYTSVLHELRASVCNALLGIENAGEILRSLHRSGIFVRGQDLAGTVYAYHPVFSAFLQQLLYQRHGAAAVLTQHQQAAQVYEQFEDWSSAIQHYLAAGAYNEASRLILEHGSIMLKPTNGGVHHGNSGVTGTESPHMRLMRWLDAIPLQVIDTQPQLRQLRDQLERSDYRGNPLVNGALALTLTADTPIDGWSAVRRATVEFAQGKYTAAIKRLRQALPTTEHDPVQRAEVLLALSTNLGALVQHREAIEACEEGLLAHAYVSHRATQLDLEMRMTRHLAYLYRDVGELDIALATSERSLYISSLEGVEDQHSRLQSLRARILMLIARGDFEAARQFDSAWEGLAQRAAASPSVSRTYALLNGRMALVEQDYVAAERWLSTAVDVGSDFTHLRLVQGDHEEALQLAQAEVAVQQTHSNMLGRWIAQTWLGIVQAHIGQRNAGGLLLDKAIDFFRQHGLIFWLAGAQLHRAWLRRTDNLQGAHEDLMEALGFGMRVGASNYAFWHPDVMVFACTEAHHTQHYLAYIHGLAVRRFSPAQIKAFQPRLHRVSDPNHTPSSTRLIGEEATELAGHPQYKDDQAIPSLHPSLEYLFNEGRLTRERAAMLMTQYRLTPREVEVLALYLDPDVRGPWRRVNEAIAKKLALSEVTVRDYISVILRKLEAPGRDRLKLRAWAIQQGIIPS